MARFDYTRVDVVDFLEELSIKHVRDEGKEVMYSCPFPGHERGDSKPSASMEKGTTRAYCFGCGWHGNAMTFISELENLGAIDAMRYLRQRYGDGFLEPKDTLLKEIDAKLAPKPVQGPDPILDEAEANRRLINWFAVEASMMDDEEVPYPLSYMLDRGFTADILTAFDVGFDHISQRVAIPARNQAGQLVGFKGRSADPDQIPKYLVLGGAEYGFEPYDVSHILFGLSRALESFQWLQSHRLIVVEGELNAIAMHQAGFDNSVGISGKRISDIQARILTSIDPTELIMVFDEHFDGLKAARKMENYCKTTVVAPHEFDPADLGQEGISEPDATTIGRPVDCVVCYCDSRGAVGTTQ